jgi:hypothetical protein
MMEAILKRWGETQRQNESRPGRNKTAMRASQEKVETTINSIWSELEETITN